MGQARRRTPRRSQARGGTGSGATLFVAGMIVGALAMLLGLRWDQLEPGGGLRTLLERPQAGPPPAPVVIAPQPVETPRLEFYEVLPEYERLMPDPEPVPGDSAPVTAAVEPAPAEPTAAAAPGDAITGGVRYVLQAGSYASHADADRLKAELALLGMEAHIQRVTIEDRGVFYRVRLGPFDSVAELDRLDARLRAQGLQPLRLRVTGAAG